jgi:hypothetical protein
MKKKLFLFLFMTCFVGFRSYSQIDVSAQQQTELEELRKKVQGTYVIEVIGRQNPLIPQDLPILIEQNRSQNQVIYITLGTMARVKILPLQEVSNPLFKKLEEEVVSVESFQ